MSVAELAALVDVSEGLVRHWESGRKPIPAGRAAELRRVFAGRSPAPLPSFSGSALRRARESAGQSQATLAQMRGVTQQAIAAWEAGAVPEDQREVLANAAVAAAGFAAGMLRAERERAGLKQAALAAGLGVPQSRVSRWECGKLPIPPDVWPHIREAIAGRAATRRQQPVTSEELRDGRRRLGWSQAQLAREIGVATPVVGNWEAGARKPVPRERYRRIREVLRLSEPTHPRDRIGEALAGVLQAVAASPGLGRRALSREVEAPEPYVRAAVLRALEGDLIHERRVKRTRSDGLARHLPGLFQGPPSGQPPLDPSLELMTEIVAEVSTEPGRSRRAIAEGLRHDRLRSERAVDHAVAGGLVHTREVIKRSPGRARVIVGVFPGKSPARSPRPVAGEKIRRAREGVLVGQAELAGRLGVSPGVLRGWERSAAPAAWAGHIDVALFPGEGSDRAAEANKRARVDFMRRILQAVHRDPGLPRRGALIRVARPVERPRFHHALEQLIAGNKVHERPSDNGHGTGIFPGPAPASYQAAGALDAGELRALRERAGLRQKDLAQRIGAGVGSVNAWENRAASRPIPVHRQAQLRALFAGLSELEPARLGGEQLIAERRRLGWTQAELAPRAGVSQATVSRWERDSPPAPLEHAERLRAFFAQAASQGQLFRTVDHAQK